MTKIWNIITKIINKINNKKLKSKKVNKIIYFLKPVANIYRHHYRTEVTGMKDDYFTILFAKLVESGQLV